MFQIFINLLGDHEIKIWNNFFLFLIATAKNTHFEILEMAQVELLAKFEWQWWGGRTLLGYDASESQLF